MPAEEIRLVPSMVVAQCSMPGSSPDSATYKSRPWAIPQASVSPNVKWL